MSKILNRNLVLAIGNYCAVAFLSMGLTVLMPLMWSTSILIGGLGMSPYQIGTILSVWGAINVVLQVLLLGPALRRFGERPVFIAAMLSAFCGTCVFAFESLVARLSGRVNGAVWILLCVQLSFSLMISPAFGRSL